MVLGLEPEPCSYGDDAGNGSLAAHEHVLDQGVRGQLMEGDVEPVDALRAVQLQHEIAELVDRRPAVRECGERSAQPGRRAHRRDLHAIPGQPQLALGLLDYGDTARERQPERGAGGRREGAR